jgi:hypothetical protein
MHKKSISTLKGNECVNDRMPYMLLRGHWCHTIVPNILTPKDDKIYDVDGSLYEELECVFDKFPKHYMKNSVR